MKINWFYTILVILTMVSSACAAQSAQGLAETPTNNAAPLLLWEGPALFAEAPTECHRLSVTQDYQAFVGLCDGEQTEIEFVTNREGGLADIIAHFAPFQADTSRGRITFKGNGEIAGPAWERAITNWAQFTHAELVNGRVGAANRTVLAWNLGEQSGQPDKCQMLLVLGHGYATAGLIPCEGGQMEVITNGWIDPADWEQFDTWLYSNAPFYQDNNYLDGRGTVEMSAKEANALVEWAETMYAKLIQK